MDLLVRGATVVTNRPDGAVLQADVLVRDGLIATIERDLVLTGIEAERTEVLDARGQALLPGFVQAHVHLVQTLFRGFADDLPLLDWLRTRIWPLEAAHDDDSLAASAELAMLEMLRSGTTTFNDMGTTHGHEVVLEAIDRFGLRARSGKCLMDVGGPGVPTRLLERRADALKELEAQARAYRHHPRVSVSVCPRFVLSCSEGLLRDACSLGRDLGLQIHSHVAEHAEERSAVLAMHGRHDLAVLGGMGVAGPDTVLAHGVQLTLDELREVASSGTSLVHCPSANLKLGSGIAKVASWLEAGVSCGLGADGAPCNNNLDALAEIRLAALLSCVSAAPAVLPAARVLRLATLDSARVLGFADRIGSIEVGKAADLVLIDLDTVHASPSADVASTIVYACRSSDVRHVVVGGVVRVRDGVAVGIDEERIVARAREAAARVARRALAAT